MLHPLPLTDDELYVSDKALLKELEIMCNSDIKSCLEYQYIAKYGPWLLQI